MKQTLILIILVGISLQNFAQDFAPVGAEWHYDERYHISEDINFIRFQSEKDTIIFGESCRKIIKRHQVWCNMRPSTEYLFNRNDTVFFFDTTFNSFQILYDFNAQANDTWIILVKDENNNIDSLIITVDSISQLQINNLNLKVLHVTYYKNTAFMLEIYYSKIIEKIGDIHNMFNWQPHSVIVCDDNYSNGLRCYHDSVIGLYSTGIADSCEYVYVWTSIEQQENENLFSVHPNPTNGSFTVELANMSNLKIVIKDNLGQVISQKVFSNKTNIDLSEFQSGIYFVSLFKNNQRIGTRKVIKK